MEADKKQGVPFAIVSQLCNWTLAELHIYSEDNNNDKEDF